MKNFLKTLTLTVMLVFTGSQTFAYGWNSYSYSSTPIFLVDIITVVMAGLALQHLIYLVVIIILFRKILIGTITAGNTI